MSAPAAPRPDAPPPPRTVIGDLPMPVPIDTLHVDIVPCSRLTVAGPDGEPRKLLASAAIVLERVQLLSDTMQGHVFLAVACGPAPSFEPTGVRCASPVLRVPLSFFQESGRSDTLVVVLESSTLLLHAFA